MKDVRNTVLQIISDYFYCNKQDLKDDVIIKDLDYDVDIVQLLIIAIELEEEFGFEITDDEVDSFVTIGDIIGCIENKIAKK